MQETNHTTEAIEVHALIKDRKSPRAFRSEEVTPEQLEALFEAARWAPSAMNEQPWRFVYATREQKEDFDRLLSCLAEANQVWAKNASVLLLTVAKTTYSANDKPNTHAWHDTALATANLVFQATAMDLHVHQMGGFSAAKAREELGIPEGYEPVTMVAVGYIGDPDSLPEHLRTRELAPRTRKPQEEIVFQGKWQQK